ncbi:protein croquemort-like isoform X2 [Eriocheir sinensis]|nr:protein croquemort-like isoform X2 [Eriocheir sinensis]
MLAGGYQAMFDAVLKANMEVVEGSRAYDIWRVTPVPMFLRFYFFNITNPEEFAAGGKAALQEVGPYCYREYHEKQNVSFHGNDTVTFLQQRWWVWDAETSGNNTQEDPIVNLNTIPISSAWGVRDSPGQLTSLNLFFKKKEEPLILTATAGQLIFDGYTDPLLDWMQNATLPPEVDLPPGLTDYDKFAWFYKRNLSLTYDGEFNMYTGHDTLDNLGRIDTWNRVRETDFYESPCNRVGGSAGEMWPPNRGRDLIDFYSPDLCMTMPIYYEEEVEDKNGLPAYRYIGNNHTFANGSVVPGNECYCVDGTCAPTGLLNAESCRYGSPAFISFPHFLHADPFLLDSVDGLSPNASIHQFNMDLIPELGIPINVEARMQINMHVIPYPGGLGGIGKIDMLSEVKEVYLPLFWFETVAEVSPKDAEDLKTLLYLMNSPLFTIIFSVMFGLGTLTLILVLLYHYFQIPCC